MHLTHLSSSDPLLRLAGPSLRNRLVCGTARVLLGSAVLLFGTLALELPAFACGGDPGAPPPAGGGGGGIVICDRGQNGTTDQPTESTTNTPEEETDSPTPNTGTMLV